MIVSETLITGNTLSMESQRNESQRLKSRTLYSVEVAFSFSEKVGFLVSETQVSETQVSETFI